MAEGTPGTAADIGAAILQGVELLQQQAVEVPSFSLADIESTSRDAVVGTGERHGPQFEWVSATALPQLRGTNLAVEARQSSLRGGATLQAQWARRGASPRETGRR